MIKETIDLQAGINYLKSTGDSLLVELGESIEKSGVMLDEKELVNLLEFFLTFSIGCGGLKLPDLANKFNERAEKFIVALAVWGMAPGKYRDPVRKRWDDVTYNRIIERATVIATSKRIGAMDNH